MPLRVKLRFLCVVQSSTASSDTDVAWVFQAESALYWSHHEKLVVVDQAVAIIGGMDLCPGRFDTSAHVLHDMSDESLPKTDYYNPKATKRLSKPYVPFF